MSFTENYGNLDDEQGQQTEQDTPLIKQLRQQLKEASQAAKSAQGAQRELAFLKAGVDTGSKVGQLFAKTFEGDLSDVETIRKEAEELGCFKPAPATEPTTPPAEAAPEAPVAPAEPSGSAERQALANGAVGNGDPADVPPVQVALSTYKDIVQKGSQEDAQAGFIQVLATAKAKEIGLTQHRV